MGVRLLSCEQKRVLRNRSFVLLWGGQSFSVFGDAFFNLAVMWVVWSETQSTLQTAIVQAVWHLPDILFAPLAGVMADRWNPKSIMVVTTLGAAAVVMAVVVAISVIGHLPPVIAFVAVFKLNSLTAFLNPARASVMPSLVGRDLLTTAQGLFSAARETATLLGTAIAGLVMKTAGTISALMVDAVSFIFVALCIAVARLPGRVGPAPNAGRRGFSIASVVHDLRDGLRTASQNPVVRVLLWLGVLINVVSFLGPLWPALVQEQLGGGATSYGALLGAGILGGILGGLLAGTMERRLGAGRVTVWGWAIGGVCTLGIAISVWLPLTMVLEFIESLGMTVGVVSSGAIMITSVPAEYRGRIFGTFRGLSVILVPASTLAGGLIAEFVEISLMYLIGGTFLLALALVGWSNAHLRNARI